MANMIEGTLKFRGTRENIEKFMSEGLGVLGHYEGRKSLSDFLIDDSDEDGIEYFVRNDSIWVKGIAAYISEGQYYTFTNKDILILCLNLEEKWGFESDRWLEISQKYNLDIRLYGIEKGMQFCQEVIIVDGKIEKDHTWKYDDWDWECPFPKMGG